MAINYLRYHPDWSDIIRTKVLKKANYQCEICKVTSGSEVLREPNGTWLECDEHVTKWAKKEGRKRVKIVLTVAFLNHLVIDARDSNMKALCQACQLHHDRSHHLLMNKVFSIVDVDELLTLLSQYEGAKYLPHLFAVVRARKNQIAQLKAIQKKRLVYNKKVKYDLEIVEALSKAMMEYGVLLKAGCEVMAEHYNHPDPLDFYANYTSSHALMIGDNQ